MPSQDAHGLPQIGTVTRQQAAEILGASVSTVRRFEEQGRLQPFRNNGGPTRYSRAEVRKLQQQRDGSAGEGELTAQAFALLDEGCSAIELVKQMHITAEQAARFHLEWGQLKGHGIWLSEAAWTQLVRGVLAIPDGVGKDWHPIQKAPTDLPSDEEAFVRAIARAQDWSAGGILDKLQAAQQRLFDCPLYALERWMTPRCTKPVEIRLRCKVPESNWSTLAAWEEQQHGKPRELAHEIMEMALDQALEFQPDVVKFEVLLSGDGDPVQGHRFQLGGENPKPKKRKR